MGEPVEELFVVASPGLEPMLLREVQGLRVASATTLEGGVLCTGSPGLYEEANLWLRTASRVLLRVGGAQVRTPAQAREALRQVELRRFWDGVTPLDVSATCHRSSFRPDALVALAHEIWKTRVAAQATPVTSSAAPQERSRTPVTSSAAPQERSRTPVTSSVEPQERNAPPFTSSVAPQARSRDASGAPLSELSVLLRLEDDVLTVSVDTSGELLHRRGYRQEVSRAPLRETLAAGILLQAGYTGREPLWDPMCGSGTLVIEGALLALGRPPGQSRGFAFQTFPEHRAEAFEARRALAASRALSASPAPLVGTDLHAGSLGTARRNARRAGLEGTITWERRDATGPGAPPAARGLLVSNLPYGKRVGERGGLHQLYRAFGKRLAGELKAWRVALLVEDLALVPVLGRAFPTRHPVSNGGLHCWLLVDEGG